MSKIQEIDKLDKAIKDAEIRLKSIRTSIEQIDKEIAVLTPLKLQLEQNLEFLKKNDTVPIAQEYKKSKSELNRTSIRLSAITWDRGKAFDASVAIDNIIDKFKSDREKLVIKSENNILKVNFGGKRGKK